MMTLDTLRQLPARLVVALTIWGESRGEPVEGQIAVASVIRNRVLRSQLDWVKVCLAKDQFTCFNEHDPNFVKIQRAADILLTQEPTQALAQALWIADGVMAGLLIDNTRGSQNYLTTDLLHSEKAPRWAMDRPILAVIGGHSFLTA